MHLLTYSSDLNLIHFLLCTYYWNKTIFDREYLFILSHSHQIKPFSRNVINLLRVIIIISISIIFDCEFGGTISAEKNLVKLADCLRAVLTLLRLTCHTVSSSDVTLSLNPLEAGFASPSSWTLPRVREVVLSVLFCISCDTNIDVVVHRSICLNNNKYSFNRS